MSKKIKIFSISFLLFISLTSAFVGNKYFEISKQLEIFNQIFRDINMFYVDEVEPKKLMDNAINGMLQNLDPYTNYMNESQTEDYMYRTEGEYGGIGAEISKIKGEWYFTEIYKDSPLIKENIKEGDKILEVNGVSVYDKNEEETMNLITGSPGSEVKLKIFNNPIEKEISLRRDNIKIKAVEYYQMLDENIGYIRLSVFNVKTVSEFLEAFYSLKDEGMKKLVLDLRGNPGGLLDQAIKMCNVFIGKDIEIVSTRGKTPEWNKSYKTENEAEDPNISIAIIVNNSSASASEIVSGSLQDLDRGIVIGQNTFGKGLVQQLRELSYNSQLKLTTSRYYIPSGRCIQEVNYFSEKKEDIKKEFRTKNGRIVYEGKGIKPDIEVKNDKKFLMILQEILQKHYIFFFVNDYLKENKIYSIDDFKLADNTFDKFLKYLEKENFNFKSKADIIFNRFQDEIKKEGHLEIIKEIDKLNSLMDKEKRESIIKYKDQVLLEISKNIIKRYFFKEGMIKFDLNNSREIKEAINILKDEKKYRQILGKK